MEVFHYCAAQLVDTDLFESCSNASLASLYKQPSSCNAYDTCSSNDVYQNEDFLSLNDCDEQENGDDEICPSQVEVEEYFLNADNDDPDRYRIDSELFLNEGSPNDDAYKAKVYEILKSDWDDYPIFGDHEERYIMKHTFFCNNLLQ